MNSFENIASQLTQTDQKGLSLVSSLAHQQLILENKVASLEAEVKETKKDLRKIQEDLLPAAMHENNMKDFTMNDGSKIEIKKFYNGSVSKEKTQEAFDWLINNNHGDLIKNVVAVNFVRGQEAKADEFQKKLEEEGESFNTRKWVEPMTLKGWIKTESEKGVEIPADLFNIYIGEKTKIDKPKS
jgi:hypothetical protein|tara:strand:+ start:405 stop:959 length:555 start_codon:yes stop_codon:yes gene_type:complete